MRYFVNLFQDVYDAFNEICFHKPIPNRYFTRLNANERLDALKGLQASGQLENMCSSEVHRLFGIVGESSEF